MSSWLKKAEPVTLEQSSTVPYVILEDGVRLCFDNLFSEQSDSSDHHIKFTAGKNMLTRQSTNYWRFLEFPVIVPFSEIVRLDNCIVNGKLIKQSSGSIRGSKTVSITLLDYLTESSSIDEYIDTVDEYDHNFVLVGEDLDSDAHLVQDVAELITHEDWFKTVVTIADRVARPGPRRFCWTRRLPELSVVCRGFKSSNDMEDFTNILEWIGVSDYDCQWSDDLF